MRALAAGTAYFAVVFAAGFVLGFLRVGQVAPRIGELPAVLLELPFMLAVSWYVCRWIVGKMAVPRDLASRMIMGGVAFGLLMAAELAMSVLLFGSTVTEHFGAFAEPHALAGLVGQLGFAAFPVALRKN